MATEKNSILGALGCSQQTWLLNRYLEWSLDSNSGVRKQDSSLVFTSVAGRDVGFYIAKDFFITNIKRIYNLYVSTTFTNLSRYTFNSLQCST